MHVFISSFKLLNITHSVHINYQHVPQLVITLRLIILGSPIYNLPNISINITFFIFGNIPQYTFIPITTLHIPCTHNLSSSHSVKWFTLKPTPNRTRHKIQNYNPSVVKKQMNLWLDQRTVKSTNHVFHEKKEVWKESSVKTQPVCLHDEAAMCFYFTAKLFF